ncbi:hypothetical protein AMECASPLE_007070 [Ameca splendens]|uniref:Uncharacterized protein n=1 Tax=Ameca splendens TaxID=208324 RepID=A0ABV0ZW98_9TELE
MPQSHTARHWLCDALMVTLSKTRKVLRHPHTIRCALQRDFQQRAAMELQVSRIWALRSVGKNGYWHACRVEHSSIDHFTTSTDSWF